MAFADLSVGQVASVERHVTEADVLQFAQVSGDMNPVHLDEEVAARSRFGQRIAHGMLTAAFVSAALGMELPGPGTIYLEQTLRFMRPVPVGSRVTVELEVLELIPGKSRVRLATRCRNEAGELVLDGVALVMVLDT